MNRWGDSGKQGQESDSETSSQSCDPVAVKPRASHGELGAVAEEVLRKCVLLCDGQGNPLETHEEMFWRVAWEVAKVERQFGRSAEVNGTAESFFEMMQALDFLPNSPTLMNA